MDELVIKIYRGQPKIKIDNNVIEANIINQITEVPTGLVEDPEGKLTEGVQLAVRNARVAQGLDPLQIGSQG